MIESNAALLAALIWRRIVNVSPMTVRQEMSY